MPRHLITVIAGLAALAALAWALWPRPVPIETASIARRDIAVTVEEEGKSRIRDVYTVSAPSSGQMLRVNLHAGDAVVKNMTVVASIRPADPVLLDARTRLVLEAAVEAARGAVDLAEAQLGEARAQLAFLKAELERASMLVRRGTIATRDYDRAKLGVDTGEAAVASAMATLTVRRRELERAQAELTGSGEGGAQSCCIDIRSPVSGRVLKVLAESEQVVQAGTPLIEIGDPGDIEIVADLLSRDAVRISPGAAAVIDGWGGAPLAATVERIDPAAVTKVSALGIEEQRVAVVLRLDGDAAAHAGMGHGFRVVARITLSQGHDLPAVPIGALFREGEHWAVYRVVEGKARATVVELGVMNGEHAEVAAGLEEGDIVILHPSDQVTDGIAVAPETTG